MISISYVALAALHLACFSLSVAVCGLYGADLHRARNEDSQQESKWLYAIVVGALSAVTCIVYLVPLVLRVASLFAAVWDLTLFVLWIALFGVFGKMYFDDDPAANGAIQRMKNVVWVDLAGALLWLTAAAATLAHWWRHRHIQSRFTGRARM